MDKVGTLWIKYIFEKKLGIYLNNNWFALSNLAHIYNLVSYPYRCIRSLSSLSLNIRIGFVSTIYTQSITEVHWTLHFLVGKWYYIIILLYDVVECYPFDGLQNPTCKYGAVTGHKATDGVSWDCQRWAHPQLLPGLKWGEFSSRLVLVITTRWAVRFTVKESDAGVFGQLHFCPQWINFTQPYLVCSTVDFLQN